MSPRLTRPARNPSPPNEESPLVATGTALGQVRRRVSGRRMAVWAALAAGPAALVLAVVPASRSVATASVQRVATPVATPTQAATGVAGHAELFLSSWLASAEGQTSEPARRVQAMAPGVGLPKTAAPVTVVSALSTVATAPGRWAVTVAATDPKGAVRYFQVPLAAVPGDRLVVVAGPAEVAAPPAADTPPSAFTVTVPTGRPLAATVAEFFTAYLGGGQIARYAVPDVQLAAPVSVVRKAEVTQISAESQTAAAEEVPADGTRVRVRVRVRAQQDERQVWPLEYGLTLAARAGRWEIAALTAVQSAPAGGAR
ncbi:conjugal transfer protein [Streptomyces sp. NPDC087440]|uniref:conjugal transfer protein n=1 Tax=Streptomyces sp. NPDC087440 TaxID=3365790 RepID=UPI0037F74848